MSDPQDLNALLRQGIELARTGQKARARDLFEQVLRADEYNELAWLWMASAAESLAQRREALEIVLEINPHNERARRALDRLGGSRARRLAEQSEWLAARIGGQAVDEEALQRVVQPPPPEPAPEPEPSPAEIEARRLEKLLQIARQHDEARQPEARPAARAAAPRAAAPRPARRSTPTAAVTRARWARLWRSQQAILPSLLVAIGGAGVVIVLLFLIMLLLQADSQLAAQVTLSVPPTATPIPLTATPTPPPLVIITRPPVGVNAAAAQGVLPSTWTPSATAPPTATPIPSATPFPPREYGLVFSSRHLGDAHANLYVVRGDGTDERRLTEDRADARDPAALPGGGAVVYAGAVGAAVELIALDLGAPSAPTLAPTATILPTPGEEATIETAEPAGAEGQAATPTESAPEQAAAAPGVLTDLGGERTGGPSWSPDGARIAFSSNADGDEEIYIISADGASIAQLTHNEGLADRNPAWSPDGGTILFASERDGVGQFEIYAMRPDGTGVTRLTDSAGSSFQPAWSPDGRSIVFVSDRDRDADLYLMDADGTNERLLTRDDGRAEDRDPAWSPDGRWIVFSSNRETPNFQLYLMDPAGEVLLRVTRGNGDDLGAAWLAGLPGAPLP